MKVSMFTKEEMHADQAEFRLLVLISKYARDPWRRSLTSQTDHWGEWRMRRVFAINRSTTKMPRECAAVGCAELQTKGLLFPFTPSRKIAVEGSFIIGGSNWKLFQVDYPMDTHTDKIYFTKGYRSRIARLSLGWSLVDGRTVSSDETSVLANSTRNISRPTKELRNTFWHLGTQCKD